MNKTFKCLVISGCLLPALTACGHGPRNGYNSPYLNSANENIYAQSSLATTPATAAKTRSSH